MKATFEQDAARAIRALAVWCGIMSIAIVAVMLLAIWGFSKASSDQAALAQSVKSPNHVRDVLLWCDAINADRAYNKTFVRTVTRGRVSYTLAALPCQQIASAAKAATAAKH